jgi:hypothetical protein
MKSNGKIGLGLTALCVSSQALAQQLPIGFQVDWGAFGVPLSPWLNVLIVLMLALATYVFLRRRADRGVMLLVGAVFVGGLSLYSERNAISVPLLTSTITTPSGSLTLYCSQGLHAIGTTVVGGVTLRVNPIYGSPPTAAQGGVEPSLVIGPECTSGTHLNPGDTCSLCIFG